MKEKKNDEFVESYPVQSYPLQSYITIWSVFYYAVL